VKKIKISIGQLGKFKEIINTPKTYLVHDRSNIIELIALLDQDFQNVSIPTEITKNPIFLYKEVTFLLQLLWNPELERFYNDVGVEARTSFPESKAIPIDTNWRMNIPDGSWIILTPDATCVSFLVEKRLSLQKFIHSIRSIFSENQTVKNIYQPSPI
jgi:hypothetical protein